MIDHSSLPAAAVNASHPAWPLLFGAWLSAAVSALGALFLGEVMGFAPCVLCWYQRIFMFPLVFVLAAGLFPFDPKAVRYGLPLAIGGWLVAVFHLLLAQGIVAASLAPCSQGVPCAQEQVAWFGFVTIPLLSVGAFSIINFFLIATYLKTRK